MDNYCVAGYCSGINPYVLGGGRFKYIGIPFPKQKVTAAYSLPLRVCHAPTTTRRFASKGTPMVLQAARTLKDVDLELIHDVSNVECLRRKSQCNVLVDQPGGLGYALNSIEGWAFGMPSITGVKRTPLGVRKWVETARQVYGQMPFIMANNRIELQDMLGRLKIKKKWEKWSRRGLAQFARFHDEATVAKQLSDFFIEAYETRR
jgi:hypothetical protein